MSPVRTPRSFRPPARQRGIALITSVMLLVVITLLAVSMFKGFGIQEKLAGNTLEKQRSFQAAQSVLQFGEWWLTNGGNTTSTATCSATVDATADPTLMRVCDAQLPKPEVDRTGVTFYKPSAMTVAAGGGKVGDDVNYSANPAVHIAFIGKNGAGASLYEVTGVGYGGTNNSVSVVQSVYAVTSSTKCLGGACAP